MRSHTGTVGKCFHWDSGYCVQAEGTRAVIGAFECHQVKPGEGEKGNSWQRPALPR